MEPSNSAYPPSSQQPSLIQDGKPARPPNKFDEEALLKSEEVCFEFFMRLFEFNQYVARLGEWLAVWGGIIFMVVMMVACWYTGLFVVCPVNGADCDSLFWFSFYVMGQLGLNVYLFHYYTKYNCVSYWQRQSCVADLCRSYDESETNAPLNGEAESMEEGASEMNGKFCVHCNREAPIRSHHCPMCKYCVLRKDHHCFVTGACVGMGNQRFFITFVFWILVGMSFVIVHLYWYIAARIPSFFPFGWVHFVGPIEVGSYLVGQSTLLDAYIASLFSFSCGAITSALGFFCLQIYYTCYGYTMYEYHSAAIREAYDGDGDTLGERFRLVFGRYYLLNFLFPMWWEKPVLTPKIATNLFRVRRKYLNGTSTSGCLKSASPSIPHPTDPSVVYHA